MRVLNLALVAAAIAALGGCTCADTVKQTRFACQVSADCLPDYACRGGECRAEIIPEGTCLPGETQSCNAGTCERPCGADGGWSTCAPSAGASFETDPLNCGECGKRCADRLGASLGCLDGRCTCTNDFDCPSGDVCLTGGVCGVNTDLCAHVTCASGSVCREGTCAMVSCAEGCKAGEVCEIASSSCRPILPCRFAVSCGDAGICEGPVQPDGEPCDDGVSCTFADSCTAGSCSGTGYSCPAPAQCQQAIACAGDGGCESVPATDGTPCDDAVSCTFGDQCVSGVCGGSAYTCTPNQCAATSVCAGDGGCDVTPRNVGTGCDDGQSCTFADVCRATGICAGTVYACPGITQCKEAGLCLGDGGCEVVNKADATPCDDGLACNVSDSCLNGACIGTPIASFRDVDNDGSGNPALTQLSCPLTTGYVLDGGDCNDSSSFVQQQMPAARDVDQDGVTASTTLDPSACVGASSIIAGRTYFRSSTGSYTWLGSASSDADCNDGDPDVFQSRTQMALDADHDGYFSGGITPTCVGASSVINGRTYYANTSGAFVYLDASAAMPGDCLDSDADVFTSRAAALDADHDGLTTTTTTSTQCVGASRVINARTYYADTSGNPNWLGSASNPADCNDSSAAIQGPTLSYRDADGDGFGAGAGILRCTPVAGESANNLDCDDVNPFINTNRNVAADADNDSFTATTTLGQRCTGASQQINGRTYFRGATGGYTWLGSASALVDCDDASATVFPQTYFPDGDDDGFGAASPGQVQCPRSTGWVSNNTDCNDGNAGIFQTRSTVVRDNDRDGYPASASDSSQCAGATSTVGTRTYYSDGAGGFWMSRGDCIQRIGTSCSPSFVDCYDLNALASFTQTGYFTTHRGDGSFDYNCTGMVLSNVTGTYCASTTANAPVFLDDVCSIPNGTATICNTPTAFALPAACGKNTAGVGTFTNALVCTAETAATSTVIGCR